MKSANKLKEYLVDFTFYGPALIFYSVIIILSVIMGVYYSLTDWDGLRKSIHFIGLENFANIIKDPIFWNALKTTLIFAFVYTASHNIIGIILAVLLEKNGRRNNVVKSLIFLPVILSPVIVSFIWDYVYAPMTGPLSLLVKLLGVQEEIGWTGNPSLALGLVIITQLWYMAGFGMVVYVAGLKSIPESYYEAARIDGANGWQIFYRIKLPLLASVSTVMLVFDMITSLKVFELIQIMTKGGPGYATETVTIMVFREAFRNSRMGYATAAGVVLFLIVMVITLIQLTILRKREVEY